MTGTVGFFETDTINFPSPAIPDFDDPSEVVGEFTSVYGNTDFGFTVVFTVDGDESNYEIISVETLSHPEFTTEEVLSSDSIRIEKDPLKVVFDTEFYEYVSYDENWNTTIERFLPELSPQETSIIEWKQPNPKIITDSYTFEVTYRDTNTLMTYITTITIPQTFYWNYIPSLNKFEQEVAESQY